jgi:hypothetical protein
VPGWVFAPQTHRRVSNINIDICFFFMEGGLYRYPMRNILRTAPLHEKKANINVDI